MIHVQPVILLSLVAELRVITLNFAVQQCNFGFSSTATTIPVGVRHNLPRGTPSNQHPSFSLSPLSCVRTSNTIPPHDLFNQGDDDDEGDAQPNEN